MSGERVERRLAAILAADIAGYSRLTGIDEEGTLVRLKAHRRDVIDPNVAEHRGRIFKTTGDGLLVEFASVVDAVRGSGGLQRKMAERESELTADRRIAFRVGIHLGDVIVESDGDLMGDGVNIAARLEGIAEPGGICLSEDAYRHARGRLDLAAHDLGEQKLKNIAEKVRAYSLDLTGPEAPEKGVSPRRRGLRALAIYGVVGLIVSAGGAVWYFVGSQKTALVAATPAQSPAVPRLSMVVLPFANLSGDASQDYFADGVTENLTTDLSRLSGSFVIARNTAFTYKGKSTDARQIGRELGVRYILEGSVQRGGHQVRVNVQLIDTQTGAHLWADRFDNPEADLFKLQDEIVARLASQLRTELFAVEARRAQRAPNPDSSDLYFQGLAWFNKGAPPANLMRAGEFFRRSLELDPNNIDARLGAANIDVLDATQVLSKDRAAHLAAAELAVNQVLAAAPDNARAHQTLGVIEIFTNRAVQGMGEAQRALALDPNLAGAHTTIGLAENALGRAEETESHVREALRLSPRDAFAFTWMGTACSAKLNLGAYEEAIAWCRRALDANPNAANARFFPAAALAQLGRSDEARSEAQAGLRINPAFTVAGFRATLQSDNPTWLAQRKTVYDGMRKAGVPDN